MDLRGKTAVITGSASGIGRAIAEKCLQADMKVVLADIENEKLNSTFDELSKTYSDIIPIKTDVSKLDDIEALADKAYNEFGSVDFLCNNAGVSDNNFVWESSLSDWNWVIGVNLWSIIYAVNKFVPRMLSQDTEAYIVNTASLAGISSSNLGTYSVTKHAVVALSETLFQSLQHIKSKIQVAVLCPGMVRTNIMESERNRLEEEKEIQNTKIHPVIQMRKKILNKAMDKYGIPPESVANILFQELEEKKFYILTHKEEEQMTLIKDRMNNILNGFFQI